MIPKSGNRFSDKHALGLDQGNCIWRCGIGSVLPPLEKGRVGVGIIPC